MQNLNLYWSRNARVILGCLFAVGLHACGGENQSFVASTTAANKSTNPIVAAVASNKKESQVCHKPGTSDEKTLTLPNSAIKAHLGHGDTLGACGVRPACSQPPIPPSVAIGAGPDENEIPWISESVALLKGATETGFNPANAPITFKFSCPTLKAGQSSIHVYDNGAPIPYSMLSITTDSVTINNGFPSGKHSLHILAEDVYGFMTDYTVEIWTGTNSIPILVVDETGVPQASATVEIKLADNPKVTAKIVTAMVVDCLLIYPIVRIT